MITEAFVNHGRWIADCARPDCASAERVHAGQIEMTCTECGLVQGVQWPADAALITSVLGARPVPGTRNWAPPGHRQAHAVGLPDGQTVDDLICENLAHGVS